MKRRLSLVLALCLCLIALPSLTARAAVITYRTGANGVSDAYAAGPYYQRLTSLPLTGDGPTDVIAVALSQVGYQEGNLPDEFGGTVAGRNNYTEFNYNMGSFSSVVGYGGPDYPWCAAFVSFCLFQAGCHDLSSFSDICRYHVGDPAYLWREISCSKWTEQLQTLGRFQTSAHRGGGYLPAPGDLVFFSSNGNTANHIGIVLFCDGLTVCTVEGNTSSGNGLDTNGGGVYVKSYPLNSSYLFGYGILPYRTVEDAKIDYSGVHPAPGVYLAARSNKYIFRNETDTDYTWILPRYALFTVTEVCENGRLKVTATERGGSTVVGYILNNEDRVIPLTRSGAAACHTAVNAPVMTGYIAHCLDYRLHNQALLSPTVISLAVTRGDTVGASGWIGFGRPIDRFGYRFENEAPVWEEAFGAVTVEEAVYRAGGTYAARFRIEAPTASLSEGTHRLTLLVALTDGRVMTLDTLTLTVNAPTAPESETTAPDTSFDTNPPSSADTTPDTFGPEDTLPDTPTSEAPLPDSTEPSAPPVVTDPADGTSDNTDPEPTDTEAPTTFPPEESEAETVPTDTDPADSEDRSEASRPAPEASASAPETTVPSATLPSGTAVPDAPSSTINTAGTDTEDADATDANGDTFGAAWLIAPLGALLVAVAAVRRRRR